MSKGVVIGGYQISNALIAALLVASTTGAGVATDSFSGITDGLDIPLSGPSDNSNNVNNTQDTDSSDDRDQQNNNQDSGDSDTGDSEGTPDEGGNRGTDSSDSDGSPSTPVDENESVVDDINDTQDQENDTVSDPVNDTEDDVDENVTEPVDGNESEDSEPTVEVPAIYSPAPDQVFESTALPLEVILTGEEASYSVRIDGEERLSGELNGEVNLTQQLDISNTGEHRLDVVITRSGEVLENQSRIFTIDSSAIDNKTGIFLTENLTAGEKTLVRLYKQGELLEGVTVFVNEDSVGTTDDLGEVSFEVPRVQEVSIASEANIGNITSEVEGYDEYMANISLLRPEEGKKLDGIRNRFQFSYDIRGYSSVDYVLFENGDKLYSGEVDENESEVLEARNVESGGNVTWNVSLFSSEGDVIASDSNRFYRPTRQELVSLTVENPSGGEEISGEVDFTWEVKTDSELPVNITSKVKDSQNELAVNQSWVDSGNLIRDGITKNLSEGQYVWEVRVLESGDILEESDVSFGVVKN